MPPRSAPAKPVTLDPQLVGSGDMFGVVRLDGLDPLIMWGTGSHLGHTAIALRDPTVHARPRPLPFDPALPPTCLTRCSGKGCPSQYS
jgi:hypothetical protein